MGSNDAAEGGASLPEPEQPAPARRSSDAAPERSRPEAARPEQAAPNLPELDRLEEAVRQLLQALAGWRGRAQAAESRAQELQAALDAVRTGALDPKQLGERVTALEAENEALRQRLRSAETIAQRIHARLQLLEEER